MYIYNIHVDMYKAIRDFKDRVYTLFESDTLFLESVCVCVGLNCLAILRIEGCLNRTL